jgi:2-polyprenyl-6-methoxyphenol hydroxylase-like FAD-dependent oxidoreductase
MAEACSGGRPQHNGMRRLADRTKRLTNHPAIIAGGLATARTLHQIGVPCLVFEAAREMRPLGAGINMQPNAVRELYERLAYPLTRSLRSRPLPRKREVKAAHTGKLSCFLFGISTCLPFNIASARAIRRRVECGMITSSI